MQILTELKSLKAQIQEIDPENVLGMFVNLSSSELEGGSFGSISNLSNTIQSEINHMNELKEFAGSDQPQQMLKANQEKLAQIDAIIEDKKRADQGLPNENRFNRSYQEEVSTRQKIMKTVEEELDFLKDPKKVEENESGLRKKLSALEAAFLGKYLEKNSEYSEKDHEKYLAEQKDFLSGSITFCKMLLDPKCIKTFTFGIGILQDLKGTKNTPRGNTQDKLSEGGLDR